MSQIVKTEQRVKITVRGLGVTYGDFSALRGVDMDIPERQVVALVGPSGCGKSTFLRSLNRLNDLIPTAHMSGSVQIEGQDIYGADVDVVALRKRVGMVFQKPNPFPMSVFDNVAFGPRLHGVRGEIDLRRVVGDSLQSAALWDEVRGRLQDSALTLSGGQQQRLCIARCLAVKPDVILMDEPASALDPISSAKVEDLIRSLRKNYTIIIVTHNMQQAARISDCTGFFLNGELIEFGTTSTIFTSPTDPRTEDYVTGRFG